MTERRVKVYLDGDISGYNRAILGGVATTRAFTSELDTSNDRAAMLTQSLLAVGPALVPIGAAGVPILSGLTNQLAFAAAGAGVTALAFSGIGDALKATNDYALEPTEANLEKMKETMNELGPAGRNFVDYLQELRPQLQGLQDIAQEGLLPGAQAGIEDLMTRLPEVERIVEQISTGMGDLLAEAGDNLADPRWDEFFTFLENEARPTLMDMGRTLGNFVEGFANLWMAFEPVSSSFSKSFLDLSRDFSAWTDGLGETAGFQEFLDYLNRVGPKAWDTLGALGGALLEIVEAAAPVGEAMLPVIEAVADSIGAIAGSDLGPAVIGVLALTSAYSRLIALGKATGGSAIGGLFGGTAVRGTVASLKSVRTATDELRIAQDRASQSRRSMVLASTSDFVPRDRKHADTATFVKDRQAAVDAEKALADAHRDRRAQLAKTATGVAGLAFVMSDLDSKMGLSNTAMLGTAGAMAGPWGAALGAGVGLTMDLANANDNLWQAVDRANAALRQGPNNLEQQREAVKAVRDELDGLRDSVSLNNGFSVGDFFKTYKNNVEDLFGRSDVEEGQEAYDKAAAALQRNEEAAANARISEAGLSEALRGTTSDTREQVDAILQLIDARNQMANEAVTALDAELAYEAALDAASAGLKKNGRSVDENVEAGRANLSLLTDLASKWNNLSDAQKNVPGEHDRMRSSFIESATAMGMSAKKAEKLADELLQMPSSVSTKVTLHGADEATAAARAVRRALNSIPGLTESTIRTYEETYVVPKKKAKKPTVADLLNPNYQANGSVLDFYANGGLRESHVAQIAPAGAMRVWAEPETGGEAYIPLAPAKRKRSQAIAMETAQRLGGVAYFADGGVRGGSSGGPMTASLVGARVSFDKDGLGTFVSGQIEMALAGSDNYAASNRRAGRK